MQEQNCIAASVVMDKHKDKYGVAEALKLNYREYDKNNFLCHSNSADFIILKNKDILPHNHLETFDFMVDRLIESLYE